MGVPMVTTVRFLRSVALAGGLTAAAALAVVLARVGLDGLAATGRGAAAVSTVVGAGAALAAAAVLGWLVLGAVVTAAELLARSRGVDGIASRIAPAATRRLVAAALGVGVACASAAPALAAPGPTAVIDIGVGAQDDEQAAAAPVPVDPGWAPLPASAVAVDPGWQPARPPDPVATTSAADLGPLATPPRPRAVAEEAVVVRRGDTLWDIAARALPAGATDAEIAAEWPRWYDANSSVIGADPDHIVPGQRLVPPGAGS